MDNATEKDIELYYKWKNSNKKEDFQNLYRQMLPLITKAGQKSSYNSVVPQSVFTLEAAQQFYNAVKGYDPTKGAKLSTHVHNVVEEKLKRVNTTYQNISRITERSRVKGHLGVYQITDLKNTEAILEDKFNRPATEFEIAASMGVTPASVSLLRSELRKDLSLNADIENMAMTDDDYQENEVYHIVYYDLPSQSQLVYDYFLGAHGKQKIVKPNGNPDTKRIAQMIGISETRVHKIRKQIGKQINSFKMGV